MADKGIGYDVFIPATFALTIVSNGIIGNKVRLGGASEWRPQARGTTALFYRHSPGKRAAVTLARPLRLPCRFLVG